jgi:hypothetical protein
MLFLIQNCFFFLIAGDCTKMVGGGRTRNVNSVYQRTRPAVPTTDEEQSERRGRRRRGQP